ncbi:MAG: PQQ-dependent catabolism-associated beta-propeller protein [Inquilinus sp.]|nr:PQQ-dependent catabolism-associated beta-propeller protein [Inquilinus sp.]
MNSARVTGIAALAAVFLAVPARAETIYVSNERDNTVSVIDGGTLELIDTIKVGRRPRGITFSKDRSVLYVCAGDSDRIDIIDLSTNRVIGRLPSGPDPELFVLHPDGGTLYIANEDDNLVTVVDVVGKRVVAEIEVGVEPEGMGISPDGRILVNTSETTNMAHFIDTVTHEIVDNVLVDSRPRVAQFNNDGSKVWVSSEIGGTVAVIDADSRAILRTIEFEIQGVPREAVQPVGIALTSDGTKAYVALGPANRVAEINQQTLEVERYHLVGQRVWNLALSPDESRLYTTNGVSSDMSVVDLDEGRVVRTIGVGRLPWGVVSRP